MPKRLGLGLLVVMVASLGCHWHRVRAVYQPPPPAEPLGTKSDAIWRKQELNAEASDFVIYQHEFEYNGYRLNMAGEDHLKQIAYRLRQGHDFPVVVERSTTTARPDTKFKYPVHPNPQLDMKRREVVVRALAAMGVHDAEQRVVVAPAYVPGTKATEDAAAYRRALNPRFGTFFGLGPFGPFGTGFGFGGFGGGF